MELELDAAEVRVLACLMEKETTTPEYYPLTLNALVNACNQKSAREPVVNFEEQTVQEALAGLRRSGVVLETTGGGNRVPKYSQRFSERFNLGRREQAILCELMLRGPQTAGELRGRAERMFPFGDLEEVENCLRRLMEWSPEPLVARLARQPGTKEPRHAHLLGGEVAVEAEEAAAPAAASAPTREERIRVLEEQVRGLQETVVALREELDRFRRQFE